MKSSGGDEARQNAFREGVSLSERGGAAEARNPLGAIGNDGSVPKTKADKESKPPEATDPLSGMGDVDKWGIKGLRTLMNNYPDYHAMVVGMDPNALGLDLGTPE